MKKIWAVLVLCCVLFSTTALAEIDVSALSDDELLALRLEINTELGLRNVPISATGELTIADAFPDTVLAMYVRDQIGAFSTHDAISQEKLDTITEVRFLSKDDGLTSLEGIQYLHNLQAISLYYQSELTSMPDNIGSLSSITRLSLEKCGIAELPDSICNLVKLKELNISKTDVSVLPDDIGNLTNLQVLDISNTKITALPDSIYGLTLKTFNREGLDID